MEENNSYQTWPPEGSTPSGGYSQGGPNYQPRPPQEPKKRGAGGYVAVGAACLLLGIALGSLITGLISLSSANITGLIREAAEQGQEGGSWEWEWSFEKPALPDQPVPDDVEPEVVETPEYITRPLPEFDGVAPSISATGNPLPDIVDSVSPGVVGIDVYYYYEEFGGEELGSYGSGFVISSEGYIVTNAHVVADASRLVVKFIDGSEAEAELVGADNKLDVAVLRAETPGLVPLALGSSADVRVGDFALAIGNPTGEQLADTATFGIISATARETNIDGQVNSYLQTDAAVNPGSSGGPLLDMTGQVIGITCAKTLYAGYDDYGNIVNAEGIGYAIPIDDAMDVVVQLITQGHVERPGIGISVVEIDEAYAAEYDIPQGILVYTVTRNGPAHQADLRISDIVLTYDGIEARESSAFVAYVSELQVGDTLQLHIWRDGEEMDITLTVADLNVIGSEILNNAYADILG